MLQRAYQQQPADLLELCEQLRFFHVDETVPMIVWAEALARRETATRAATTGTTVLMRDSWRPLLVEELSKEAYNLTSELQAVLDSEAWEDAARIITSIDPEAAPGVSPYVKDRQLLTSLPVAVQLLLSDYPALQGALGERFGPLAKLRIGQAIAAGDASAVELATVQFGATAESAEALRWLGDRALSNGWFEEAIVHYQRATDRHPLLASELAPRIRLAAAMLGRDLGTPVTSVVQFNDLKMDAAQFEALVAEMRGRGTSAAVSAVTQIMPGASVIVPPPTEFAAHNRSRLDGPTGDKPQEEVGRKTNQFAVPWPDKQLSVTVAGDIAYVTNRFQLAAYNLTNGQRLWQNEVPPGSMQKAQDWALIAMKPLMLRDHILTRQLYGKSPQIVCMNKADGKRVWSAERGEREFFISDPVYLHGQIVALSITLQDQQDGQGQVRWNVLDPATGELQAQRDLVRLRATWGARAVCEVLPLDHQLLVALGGVTLALDARGQVAWVRKQVTLPADEDPRWVLQTFHRPILADGRVVLSQPGTRSVISLDPATGLKHWETLIPDVLGVWGISKGQVICQTEAGVQALDVATGKRTWSALLNDLQPHALVDDQRVLVARKGLKADDKKPLIELTWLDAATGQPQGTTQLAALTDGTPRLGPLVPYKDRLFTFFGKGQHDPNRDVVELVPSGPLKP
jgi:outer membrane protein assembly factor BamB